MLDSIRGAQVRVLAVAEYFPQMDLVLLFCLAADQDVVQVGKGTVLTCQALEALLEGFAGIPHPKAHPGVLEEAKRGGEGRLGDVLRVHRNLVVL